MRVLNAPFIGYALRKRFPGPWSGCVKWTANFIGDNGPMICEPYEVIVRSPIFKGLGEAQQREIVTATLKIKIKGLDKEIDEMNIKTEVSSDGEEGR